MANYLTFEKKYQMILWWFHDHVELWYCTSWFFFSLILWHSTLSFFLLRVFFSSFFFFSSGTTSPHVVSESERETRVIVSEERKKEREWDKLFRMRNFISVISSELDLNKGSFDILCLFFRFFVQIFRIRVFSFFFKEFKILFWKMTSS